MTPNSVAFATSFAAAPEPVGPTCSGVPSASSSSRCCAKTSASPPTKIASDPSSASLMLPSTGASSSLAERTDASRSTASGADRRHLDHRAGVVGAGRDAVGPFGDGLQGRRVGDHRDHDL